MAEVTREEIRQFAGTRSKELMIMISNDYMLGHKPHKCSLFTMDWMQNVIEGKYWCPKESVEDNGHGIGITRHKTIVDPPRMTFIMSAIDEVL
jgi:hypothetical protein